LWHSGLVFSGSESANTLLGRSLAEQLPTRRRSAAARAFNPYWFQQCYSACGSASRCISYRNGIVMAPTLPQSQIELIIIEDPLQFWHINAFLRFAVRWAPVPVKNIQYTSIPATANSASRTNSTVKIANQKKLQNCQYFYTWELREVVLMI
jgi:hypothetical protein